MVQAHEHADQAAVERSARPDLLRGLTQPRYSRRRFVRGAAGLIAAGSLAGVMSACGIAGTRNTGWKDGFDWKGWWSEQEQQGTFDFANWPLYIDRTKDGSPTLNDFSAKTGITVNYRPVIQDNASFFAQISPVLQAKQSTGYDMVVISNGWELTQMIENHWLIPLDHSRLPNFRRYASPAVRDPVFDPGNEFTVAWQSGITGIAYDPEMVGRKITSFKDLWDPAFKGKVGMMADNTELGSIGMLALDIEPSTRRRRTGTARPTCCASSARRASSVSTTTRATSRHWSRATRGSAWPGPATSSRRRSRATQTSSSPCPTRARCSGRTTA